MSFKSWMLFWAGFNAAAAVSNMLVGQWALFVVSGAITILAFRFAFAEDRRMKSSH